MHLHGFFYDVLSLGRSFKDDIYEDDERRTVVTEFMKRRTTMSMEWTPSREGNWLFHCHLSFHVTAEIRLPTAPENEHVHMAGLVLGITVQPGESDLISEGDPAYITLHVNEYKDDSLAPYGFSFDADFRPDSLNLGVPGPILFLKRHQSTYVTVKNHMSIPTGIHWHGLELDSWADGVPNWSASDGKVSPVIQPGEEFTYKLSAMRSGTFIYHSHLNDIEQLSGGLYGPLIVLDSDEDFNYDRDHIYSAGWNSPEPQYYSGWDLNGRSEKPQPDIYARVGEAHRLRLINIAPAGAVMMWMIKDGEPVEIQMFAKDGADLPVNQRINVEVGLRIGVGETVDHLFSPLEPGIYELRVGNSFEYYRSQKWIVR